MTVDPQATREGWLEDVGASLRPLKDVYDADDEQDARALDVALSFVGTMCAKMNFATPTREELTTIMANERIGGMITTSRLIYAAEREEGRIEGERDGRIAGERDGRIAGERDGRIAGERDGRIAGERDGRVEGKQNVLAKLIGLRFPSASASFIKKVSKPINDSYVDELMSVVLATSTLDEFKKKVKALKPC